MSDGPDEFISSVYGTGMSYQEKVAAEQTNEVVELEKAAAVEAFTDAMITEGLDPQQFTDEQIEAGFNQYYNDMSKTAAEAPVDEAQGEEMIKQAWAEADAIGRQLAQRDFVQLVKQAATEYELKQMGLKKTPKGELTEAAKKAVGVAKETKKKVMAESFSAGRGRAPAGMRAKHFIKGKIPAAAGQIASQLKSTAKKHPYAAAGLGALAAGQAAGAGYGAYRGGKYLKERQEKAASLETPFLDDAIEKCAMAIAVTNGAMTPDGETNMNSGGEYIYEPSWVEEYELEMPKTALDEVVFNAALAHLEELGYPIDWSGGEGQ